MDSLNKHIITCIITSKKGLYSISWNIFHPTFVTFFELITGIIKLLVSFNMLCSFKNEVRQYYTNRTPLSLSFLFARLLKLQDKPSRTSVGPFKQCYNLPILATILYVGSHRNFILIWLPPTVLLICALPSTILVLLYGLGSLYLDVMQITWNPGYYLTSRENISSSS